MASEHACKYEARPLQVKERKKERKKMTKKERQKSSVSIQTILLFICDGVSNVDGYKKKRLK